MQIQKYSRTPRGLSGEALSDCTDQSQSAAGRGLAMSPSQRLEIATLGVMVCEKGLAEK